MALQVTGTTFKHDAVFYDGRAGFVARVGGFVRDGVRAGDHVLVMVTPDKIDLLRRELGDNARRVAFRDMAVLGANPARIIPAWRDYFLEASSDGRGVRGVGEPIWAGRPADELVESQRHEALINLAFSDADGWLICPYDMESLDRAVLAEALHSHPAVFDGASRNPSGNYIGHHTIARPFDDALPEPVRVSRELSFDITSLSEVRSIVRAAGYEVGLSSDRSEDLVVSVVEAVTNTIRHGGGSGRLRVWTEDGSAWCEVSDVGRIGDPLVGRMRPNAYEECGYGLWIANQLCDLVQIRSGPAGTVVRLRVSRR